MLAVMQCERLKSFKYTPRFHQSVKWTKVVILGCKIRLFRIV